MDIRNKRNQVVTFLLFGVLASVMLAACSGTTTEAAADEGEADVQTSTVRRGDISISATGAGTVIPATDVELGFSSSGTLDEVLVAVGDEVEEGTPLAQLDSSDAEQAVLEAELQLNESTLQVDGSATEAGVSFSDITVEQARLELETAQTALDELLNWEPDEDEIALAQAQLETAQAGYQAALGQSTATSNNVQVSAISLEQAQRSLNEAQDAYNVAFDPGRDWELNDPRKADALQSERDSAASALLRAQESLTVAQLDYDDCRQQRQQQHCQRQGQRAQCGTGPCLRAIGTH
ncbi:MAG: biotin/lipoyl-binding protein [Chloroflexota bacterium]